jgi:hypothetical protein
MSMEDVAWSIPTYSTLHAVLDVPVAESIPNSLHYNTSRLETAPREAQSHASMAFGNTVADTLVGGDILRLPSVRTPQ